MLPLCFTDSFIHVFVCGHLFPSAGGHIFLLWASLPPKAAIRSRVTASCWEDPALLPSNSSCFTNSLILGSVNVCRSYAENSFSAWWKAFSLCLSTKRFPQARFGCLWRGRIIGKSVQVYWLKHIMGWECTKDATLVTRRPFLCASPCTAGTYPYSHIATLV